MKLLCSHTSPYARKVRIVALEKGIELEEILTNPLESPDWLLKVNPLSKVPALITRSGETLYDSRVICEYLDSQNDQNKLLAPAGKSRWLTLRQQALSDGLLDAAVASVFEGKRSDAQQSAHWKNRWDEAIKRSVSVMAQDITGLQSLTLGSIGCATALAYLDFRHANLDWRKSSKKLSHWLEQFSDRESFRATAPPN